MKPWRLRQEAGMADIESLLAGVAVSDFPAAVDWYTRLLGHPADIVAHETEVLWHLAGAAWLYVLADRERAGHALVTVSVADLDFTVAEIASRGITTGSAEHIGDAGRKATFSDADGNSIAFIEVTGPTG
jgi:catechol 2,3-dioxygenase-like lactoylglutathione lyase family enzyme